jgi:hypothetical protein
MSEITVSPVEIKPIVKIVPVNEPVKKITWRKEKVEDITVENATNILRDKIHEKMKPADIRAKYDINNMTYKYVITEFSDIFVVKFGKNKKPLKSTDFESYWK